jgi:hypothetical protein
VPTITPQENTTVTLDAYYARCLIEASWDAVITTLQWIDIDGAHWRDLAALERWMLALRYAMQTAGIEDEYPWPFDAAEEGITAKHVSDAERVSKATFNEGETWSIVLRRAEAEKRWRAQLKPQPQPQRKLTYVNGVATMAWTDPAPPPEFDGSLTPVPLPPVPTPPASQTTAPAAPASFTPPNKRGRRQPSASDHTVDALNVGTSQT